MANNNQTNGGIGCLGLLTILLQVAFIVLKLCGVIAWSWVMVCLPIIIYAGLTVLAYIIVFIYYLCNS